MTFTEMPIIRTRAVGVQEDSAEPIIFFCTNPGHCDVHSMRIRLRVLGPALLGAKF